MERPGIGDWASRLAGGRFDPRPAAVNRGAVPDLVRRQAALQAQASAVNEDLRLDALVAAIGEPVRVGSSALGLMVWRDLDITVVCPVLDVAAVAAVAAVGARLATHHRVRQVRFRNDTGQWNTDPRYPDGLFLGLRYRAPDGEEWNVDVWFVDQPQRQPDLAHLRTMPARLTPEVRHAILEIKDAWAGRPEYGSTVGSHDIYTAVLDGGVRTLEQFQRWLTPP